MAEYEAIEAFKEISTGVARRLEFEGCQSVPFHNPESDIWLSDGLDLEASLPERPIWALAPPR